MITTNKDEQAVLMNWLLSKGWKPDDKESNSYTSPKADGISYCLTDAALQQMIVEINN